MTVELDKYYQNPELTTFDFQQIWADRENKLRKAGVDLKITIPACPYTREELAQLERKCRRVGYLPQSLATQETRHLLVLIWPEMKGCSVQKGNTVTNTMVRSGWFDYETDLFAPNEDKTIKQIEELFKSQGREGMNLNEYIVASQDSRVFALRHLDQLQGFLWSRLLGSRHEGHVVCAQFNIFGNLYVGWDRRPGFHYRDLGSRSVGVPKKT